MSLCKFVFTSIKSDDFQFCCVILKGRRKNSGFIAATLYIVNERFDNVCNIIFKENATKILK